MRRLLCAAVLATLLTSGGAAATTPPKKVWVGSLKLTYFRHYEKDTPNGTAVEKDSRSVSITNTRKGTAFATGRIRSTTAYPCSNGTSSGRIEAWDVGGAIRPVAISFGKTRYQVRFANPSERVTIEERDCTDLRTLVVKAYAMDVGFQLYGKVRPGATRLTGSWKHLAPCSGSCISHEWQGRWDFRLVPLAR
jgi:hypothetical protein